MGVNGLTVEDDITRVPGINARQNFNESRFASAIFAHKGVDFAGAEGEIDGGESFDAGEGFGD